MLSPWCGAIPTLASNDLRTARVENFQTARKRVVDLTVIERKGPTSTPGRSL